LLSADLRKTGAGCLPDDVNRAHSSSIKGPLVLQVRLCLGCLLFAELLGPTPSSNLPAFFHSRMPALPPDRRPPSLALAMRLTGARPVIHPSPCYHQLHCGSFACTRLLCNILAVPLPSGHVCH
jgi:hypothetical protein